MESSSLQLSLDIPLELLQTGDFNKILTILRKELKATLIAGGYDVHEKDIKKQDSIAESSGSVKSTPIDLESLHRQMEHLLKQNASAQEEIKALRETQDKNYRLVLEKLSENEKKIKMLEESVIKSENKCDTVKEIVIEGSVTDYENTDGTQESDDEDNDSSIVEYPTDDDYNDYEEEDSVEGTSIALENTVIEKATSKMQANESSSLAPKVLNTGVVVQKTEPSKLKEPESAMTKAELLCTIDLAIKDRSLEDILNVSCRFLDERDIILIGDRLLQINRTDESHLQQLFLIARKIYMDCPSTGTEHFPEFIRKLVLTAIQKRRSALAFPKDVMQVTQEKQKMYDETLTVLRLIGALFNYGLVDSKLMQPLLIKLTAGTAPNEKTNKHIIYLISTLFDIIEKKLYSDDKHISLHEKFTEILLPEGNTKDSTEPVDMDISDSEPPKIETTPVPQLNTERDTEEFMKEVGHLVGTLSEQEVNVLYDYHYAVNRKLAANLDKLDFNKLSLVFINELIKKLWRIVIRYQKHSNEVPFAIEVLEKIRSKLSSGGKQELLLECIEIQARKKFNENSKIFHNQIIDGEYHDIMSTMRFIGEMFNKDFVDFLFVQNCLAKLKFDDTKDIFYAHKPCLQVVKIFIENVQEKLIVLDIDYLFQIQQNINRISAGLLIGGSNAQLNNWIDKI